MAPQKPLPDVFPYFTHRFSMDTKGSITPSSDRKLYIYVFADAFLHYVVFRPSPRNDAINALNALFDHWIVKLGVPKFLDSYNGNQYIDSDFTHFGCLYNVQFKPRTPYAT